MREDKEVNSEAFIGEASFGVRGTEMLTLGAGEVKWDANNEAPPTAPPVPPRRLRLLAEAVVVIGDAQGRLGVQGEWGTTSTACIWNPGSFNLNITC